MRSEDKCRFGFRLLPKTEEEWRGAFLFLSRSYVVIALVVREFFWTIGTNGKSGYERKLVLSCFYEVDARLVIGYAFCLLVLSLHGICDLIVGRWRSGCLDLCFAGINALVLSTMSFAIS